MIQFQHVFKEYRRSAMPVVALRDLCVDIPQGEFLCADGAKGQRKKYALAFSGRAGLGDLWRYVIGWALMFSVW